jgi:hypothetical protein
MKYLHNIWFFPRTFDSKDETLVKAADKKWGTLRAESAF